MDITYAPIETHLEIKILLCDREKLQNHKRFMKEE